MARGNNKVKKNGTTTNGDVAPKHDEAVNVQQKEAAKEVVTVANSDISATPSIANEKSTTNGNGKTDQDGQDKGKNAFIREIEKRLAKVNKKKRSIETIEAKLGSATPEVGETTKLINADERKKLLEKPLIDKQIAEYQDILSSYGSLVAEEDKIQASEKEAWEAETTAKVLQAHAEGKAEGVKAQRELLQACFKFLRLAGYRRAVPDDNAAENDAIEKVLVMVYSSEDTYMKAVESLSASSKEVIEASENISWAQIKEASEALALPEDDVEYQQLNASQDLGESTIIVTDGDAEDNTTAPPPQTLTSTLEEEDTPIQPPPATNVDDAAANEAAKNFTPTTETNENPEGWDTSVNAGGQSEANGGPANIVQSESWAEQAEQATEAAASGAKDNTAEEAKVNPTVPIIEGPNGAPLSPSTGTAADVATPHSEGAFQEVKHGRGRGGNYRGNSGRGGNDYRGDYRGNYRGGRGGGNRGRGGEGYRGRGNGEYRGGYRGRGNYRGRGGHDHAPVPQPPQV